MRIQIASSNRDLKNIGHELKSMLKNMIAKFGGFRLVARIKFRPRNSIATTIKTFDHIVEYSAYA